MLGLGKGTRDLLKGGAGVVSPWQPDTLTPVILADLFDGVDIPAMAIDRARAITIPAVSKGRNLLVSAIAKMPLRCLNADDSLAAQPEWMYRSDSNVTPYERMAWTVDDLIFYGYSLWEVRRGNPETESGYGPILDAAWVPRGEWAIEDGYLKIRGVATSPLNVILFNSPFEGLLTIARRTLRGAIDQEDAWVGRARNPIPLIELHETEESEIQPDEIAAFVKAWSAARRAPDGAIGYTPKGLEIRVHGTVAADLMIEGRNAIRTDVGSFINIRASMLDGTAGIDSLTYSTTEGEKNSFYEFDLPFWTDPIEARLSMDDVVPESQRIRLDKYDQYKFSAPTGIPTED